MNALLTAALLEAGSANDLLEVLTKKGREIMASMKDTYGGKKGESVFYASKNAGKITGVEESREAMEADVQEAMCRFAHKMKARHDSQAH